MLHLYFLWEAISENLLARTYLRDRLEQREWAVIPWGLPGEPIVGSLTREVSAALDIAVHCIELSAGAPFQRCAVAA